MPSFGFLDLNGPTECPTLEWVETLGDRIKPGVLHSKGSNESVALKPDREASSLMEERHGAMPVAPEETLGDVP